MKVDIQHRKELYGIVGITEREYECRFSQLLRGFIGLILISPRIQHVRGLSSARERTASACSMSLSEAGLSRLNTRTTHGHSSLSKAGVSSAILSKVDVTSIIDRLWLFPRSWPVPHPYSPRWLWERTGLNAWPSEEVSRSTMRLTGHQGPGCGGCSTMGSPASQSVSTGKLMKVVCHARHFSRRTMTN